MYEHKND